jgi:hypothetical protein
MGVILVSGMTYMLWWPTLVANQHRWVTGGDLWGIFRAAHYVGWGFLGGVYEPANGVDSLPGLEVLLAPVAMLSGHLGLTEVYAPYFTPKPTAALLLEPIELLLASTVLFAGDALAERLGASKGRRIFLCVVVGILVWPTVAIWGHAEDCLALALALYALLSLLNGRWKACGWLFGFALVFQPLVVMMLPLVVAASPVGRRVSTALRSVALPVVLVAVSFVSDAADTYRSLVQQPTPPSVNHPTPWLSLAPRVPNVLAPAKYASVVSHAGRFVERPVRAHPHAAVLVSGGAGRAIEVVLALLVGVYVWRRPQPPHRLIWLAASCLGMRCFFEAVMTPYYLAPPLIAALIVASCRGGKRFWAACLIALEISWFAYHNLSPWAWWLPIIVGMAAALALGFPNSQPAPSTGPAALRSDTSADHSHTELRELGSPPDPKDRAAELIG